MTTLDFRTYLQQELVRRCQSNPNYSLRAFARSAGVNPAILSMILRKKRKVTSDAVRKIGAGLGLSQRQIESFASHISEEAVSSNAKTKQMNQLSLDTFYLITEWYHDAIMELSRIEGFGGTPLFISRALGISVNEAQLAIERLERIGMIEVNADNTWNDVGEYTSIQHDDFTDVALRRFQEKVLELSSKTIKAVPKELRDHSCMTMAVRRSDLKEAKKRIREFRRDMNEFLQRKSQKPFDDVYCFALSLFPLTNKYKKETV
ncbi:MAG: DUF4423 domain-containing protein [Bdellovibrionales bacterium]